MVKALATRPALQAPYPRPTARDPLKGIQVTSGGRDSEAVRKFDREAGEQRPRLHGQSAERVGRAGSSAAGKMVPAFPTRMEAITRSAAVRAADTPVLPRQQGAAPARQHATPGPSPLRPKAQEAPPLRARPAPGPPPGAARHAGRGWPAKMAVQVVQAVHLESDAFLVCLNHALSTEKEEVMGLCIGELNDDTRSESKVTYAANELRPVVEKVDSVKIIHIHSVIILRRSDKRKDRVEISPEQLSAASTEAERLAEITGRPMRVVGWYHSHPHITVWPSHVDVRTQAMYQMMDQGFVGLIFSCFIEDKNTKTGRVLYTCFQSIQAQKSSESPHGSQDFWSSGQHISTEGQKEEERYERIEIPIHIVPHVTIGKVCLESAVELPKILCQEEQDAYRRIHSLTHLDSVTKIHNGSVFTKNLCSQMSAVSGPLLQWLEDRLEQNQQHLQELQQEKEELMQELSSLE
ncbi:PREDICTED: lys-63-specific deubiquitinase BRCC36 [Elephantulus edwardii]|uniref:lys-63-specific deubiquitinase BRCC36 n=1 Tax=Elephantulus edwardii TaxID=28737 RepID=UPI0003F0CFB0|nr:PREDICTED: lys-63-specific deubiquitinase BRCC36 [Elephantulus edwardii]